MERFWTKVEKTDGCWNWTAGTNPKGYGEFRYQGTKRYAHRVAFHLKNGRWPEDCLMHTCDNPGCVNPDHLVEGSRGDNNRDMFAKGRGRPTPHYRTENGNAKHITDRILYQINALLDAGWSSYKIGNFTGVGSTTVLRIKNGEHWSCRQ